LNINVEIFMKLKTSGLKGRALSWAVAKADNELESQGGQVHLVDGDLHWYEDALDEPYDPLSNWAQGGPILSRERISRTIVHSGLWIAYNASNYSDEKEFMQCDVSELVAGLRCFVESKLGETVEIPKELT